MRTNIFFFFIVIALTSLGSITAQKGRVIISEIMYDSPLNENMLKDPANNGEYIELYNAGSNKVDLSTWHLIGNEGAPFRFPSGTYITPGEYLIVAYRHYTSDFNLRDLMPNLPSGKVLYQSSIVLNNSGEKISLVSIEENKTKDQIFYGKTANLTARNGEGKDIDKCLSVHRVRCSFDKYDCAISNDADWTSGLLTPFAKHSASNIKPLQEIGTDISMNKSHIVVMSPQTEVSTLECDNGVITTDINVGDASKINISIQYYDGLGRPNQHIQYRHSPQFADIVTHTEYDSFGRAYKVWQPLPLEDLGNLGAYNPIIRLENEMQYIYPGETHAYSLANYENSPLSRVIEEYGPGSSWRENGGKPVKIAYKTNDNKYNCIRFSVGKNGGDYFLNHGWYPNGELFVTETKDEDGKTSYEFKNKLGQVVLTSQAGDNNIYHNTYYIYDDFGNLCYILPPILSDRIIDSGAEKFDTGTEVMQYAYIYKYDERNRCIKKKLPGCDWIYYIYDKADHLIYSQDGEQRKRPTKMGQDPEGIWTFTIYDAFNRVVLIGESECPSYAIKGYIYTAYYDPTADSYNRGYRHDLGLNYRDYLTVNYYDNYDFLKRDGFKNLNYVTKDGFDTRHGDNNDLVVTKGLLTGTAVKILGSNTYIYTAFYYDKKGQLIQTVSTNHIGGIDKTFMAYNFSGQPVKQYVQHSGNFLFNITELTEDYAYTYDHAGRLKTTTRNGVVIESLSYNELGQVEGKKQGTSFDAKYTYNIRGWITQQKDNGGSKFAMDIKYQDHQYASYKQYNGNISQISYNYGGYPVNFNYTYDNLNRLSNAQQDNLNYSENLTYDKHGNISTIFRASEGSGWYTDVLTLYHTGNQLSSLSNEYPDINGSKVVEYLAETATFTYNANGALTSDSGRGIDSIKYNSLNLPQRIKFNNGNLIEYTYSASGEKLQAKHTTKIEPVTQPINGESIGNPILTRPQIRTTDYVGNILLESGTLMLNTNIKMTMLFNGGYEEYRGARSVDGVEYTQNTYFQLKDYLGNIRDVKRDGSNDIIQRTEYLPFGTPFKQEVGDAGAQRYKFGGKEFDQMHGLNMYDFHARQYNPLLGRFHTVDPMAEKYYSWSPYAYVMNNPMRYIDPDGCSTHTDSLGHVVAVYNDGNMGVFKHDISADSYDGSGLLAKNGKNMGETDYWDEFLDLENGSSNVVGTIKFGESWDDIIGEKAAQARDMDIKDIAMGSKPGGPFDIKKDYPNGEGRLLNGKYATARSAGNYLAGYNASQSEDVPGGFATFQKLAGAVHVKQRAFSKWDAVNVVVFRNTYGPAPYYGEIYYQYRRSLAGWKDAKKK